METSNKSPDPADVALGAVVRVRRRLMNMSQEVLAEHCGVSFQQIQKYENGSNRISFSRLMQIARALDCRVTDLVEALEDGSSADPRDLDLLGRLRTPGAIELLDLYEQLQPSARGALVQFVRSGMLHLRSEHLAAPRPSIAA